MMMASLSAIPPSSLAFFSAITAPVFAFLTRDTDPNALCRSQPTQTRIGQLPLSQLPVQRYNLLQLGYVAGDGRLRAGDGALEHTRVGGTRSIPRVALAPGNGPARTRLSTCDGCGRYGAGRRCGGAACAAETTVGVCAFPDPGLADGAPGHGGGLGPLRPPVAVGRAPASPCRPASPTCRVMAPPLFSHHPSRKAPFRVPACLERANRAAPGPRTYAVVH